MLTLLLLVLLSFPLAILLFGSNRLPVDEVRDGLINRFFFRYDIKDAFTCSFHSTYFCSSYAFMMRATATYFLVTCISRME